MTKAELDYILGTMLDFRENVSDLNLTTDKTLQVESSGELVAVPFDPPIEKLTPFQTEAMALQIIDRDRRLTEELVKNGSCDCSYSLGQKARFRVNIFSQRGNYSVILRKLTTEIPTVEQLNLPPVFHAMAKEKTGLILVTGSTGSGKSTTLAALLNELNESKPIHVVTLEDPVEFVHPQKRSTFNQRELGVDFSSFASGLRSAMRQAPK
jgi:twitching motility protein PilT